MEAESLRLLRVQIIVSALMLTAFAACALPAHAQQSENLQATGTVSDGKDNSAPPTDAEKAEQDAWNKTQDERLVRGDALVKEKKPEAAIREAFDPIIRDFEARYASDRTRYYCARTSVETFTYMLSAAAEHDRMTSSAAPDAPEPKGVSAVALGPTWAYAHFGKAYALIDLNRFDEAAREIDRALELSPFNPQFLSERAYLYRATREWDKMLETYRSSYSATEIGSPDHLKATDQARALRGEGFALIELGELKDAEKSFKKSLKLEPKNEIALHELDYIKQLRTQKK